MSTSTTNYIKTKFFNNYLERLKIFELLNFLMKFLSNNIFSLKIKLNYKFLYLLFDYIESEQAIV